MAEQWVCENCGHTTPLDPGAGRCPECGSKMTQLDDFDEDLSSTDDDSYDDEQLAASPDDEFDDWEEEDGEDKPKGKKDLKFQDDKEE